MIEVTVDSQAVMRVLRDLERSATRMGPAFKSIGEHLINTTGHRFRDSKGPDGKGWTKNEDSTLARKESTRPLIGETGRLENEIIREASDQGVLVASTVEYAAMQQFGGTKSEFPHLWADIPARPFLGVSSEDEAEIGRIVLEHLRHAAKL